MAYRLFQITTTVGDDSNLQQVDFDRSATLTQVADLIVSAPTARVLPGSSEVNVALGTLVQGYAVAVYSDYPVLVRFNGASATQFQLTSNGVTSQNVGAPFPPACFIGGTFLVSSVRIAPINGSGQTANVWIVATGDPSSTYI